MLPSRPCGLLAHIVLVQCCIHCNRVQVNVVITALMASLSLVTAITSIFGMNLFSGLEEVRVHAHL